MVGYRSRQGTECEQGGDVAGLERAERMREDAAKREEDKRMQKRERDDSRKEDKRREERDNGHRTRRAEEGE